MASQPVPERLQISPFLVFYLVMSMQVGIGVLGFQRILANYAGYDGWISIIIAGFVIHGVMWAIYKIAETVDGDIVTAHEYFAGRFLGRILSSVFILYFMLYMLTVLRTYIEVIQTWIFPEMGTFWFALGFITLCIYIVAGGFRTVAGIAFFGLVLPTYLVLTLGFTFKFSDFTSLLPVWDHSIKDIVMGSYAMTLTYIGFEIVLFIYPFIKNPRQSKKWAHLAILSTTLLYVVLAIITFGYFSEGQLQKNIWATLSIWQITRFPFVERFEYIGIANWNLIILPNICISLWAASRILKRLFHVQQRKGILFIAGIIVILCSLFQTRASINILNDYTGKIGFFINFIYLPMLLVAVKIAKKVKKQ
ncbi:MAG: GerAB/ArcD/ProY family transporter [Cytobacillus gottheilii]|uniref:GerAB/ArcD/ProY family transporter n=1 Tax=Cytobacillus gottheilii TaxID=859144 RepID=UPI00082AC32D|nr:GerAB/ArcD/ProY family transporter [Cytobacillus gottheilii]